MEEDIYNLINNLNIDIYHINDEDLNNITENIFNNLEEYYENIKYDEVYDIIINYIQESPSRESSETSLEINEYSSNNNRSYLMSLNNLENDIKLSINEVEEYKTILLKQQVEYLKTVKQPKQLSDEWYVIRKNMITASEAGGILGMSKYNKRKDVMLKKFGFKPFKGNIATRHGQLFEDVAAAIYESRNNTKVYEYGLITHEKYKFLGASPDGISKDGIMLEIKCPYSRKINGIIKCEKTIAYWVQIQMQLEVCGLFDCDFLECTIKTYYNRNEYFEDKFNKKNTKFISLINGYKKADYIKVPYDRRTEKGLEKGVLGKFINNETRDYFYIYPPFNLDSRSQENYIKNYKNPENTSFISNIYWKLITSSCIRVKRDIEWFNKILPKLKDFYDEMQERKIKGCEDIMPKKKAIVKKNIVKINDFNYCLINSNSDDKNNKKRLAPLCLLSSN